MPGSILIEHRGDRMNEQSSALLHRYAMIMGAEAIHEASSAKISSDSDVKPPIKFEIRRAAADDSTMTFP